MARHILSKEERETIILTSEADDTYDIFTYNLELKRKLKKYAKRFPEMCRLTKDDREFGSMTFVIRKSQVSLRFMEPASEEKRNEAREKTKRINSARSKKQTEEETEE